MVTYFAVKENICGEPPGEMPSFNKDVGRAQCMQVARSQLHLRLILYCSPQKSLRFRNIGGQQIGKRQQLEAKDLNRFAIEQRCPPPWRS